ncbi:hypothetical protein ABER02_05430 [Rossellomorea marisflavi]|uniref:hypothetical protein n=1 Tax=Rossellomorea marisflavi TaxID=189381 RepID=UPI000A780AE9|nr:hypothetical protein [Rossellomorea marisflavi]
MKNQIGFDFLRKWVERELMIFKNVVDVCGDGTDCCFWLEETRYGCGNPYSRGVGGR